MNKMTINSVPTDLGTDCARPKDSYARQKDINVINTTKILEINKTDHKDQIDHKMDIDAGTINLNEPLMIQIIDGLYLGNRVTAKDVTLLMTHNIKGVVNVTQYCCNYFPNMCNYLNIRVINDLDVNIKSHFSRTCDFIHERVINGNPVLVHCMQGRGRSVTIILAYLIYRGYSLADAYHLVKEKRSEMFPNMTFFENLMEWERTLTKQNTNTMTQNDLLFEIMCEIHPNISKTRIENVIQSGLQKCLSYDLIAASLFDNDNATDHISADQDDVVGIVTNDTAWSTDISPTIEVCSSKNDQNVRSL